MQLKFREFVARHIGEVEGIILEAESGDFLGKHRGFWFYTIGQRQGLGLPGGPWYDPISKQSLSMIPFNHKGIYHLLKCLQEQNSF